MIDASKSFRKDGAKNRLRERDIHRIVDVFNEQRETPGYARMVPVAEIASETNDYNLNIPPYVDSSEAEDLHDLGASVRIPQQRLGFPGTGPSGVRRGTRAEPQCQDYPDTSEANSNRAEQCPQLTRMLMSSRGTSVFLPHC